MIAVVMLSMIIITGSIAEMKSWSSSVLYGSTMLFGCWLAYFGVYRVSGLHYLWGWGCLIGSLFLTGFLVYTFVIRGHLPTKPLTPRLITGIIALPTLGYLLIIDRRVRDYRRSLSIATQQSHL